MKDLTIEEKAQRYDEALEKLRGLLEGIREEKCEIMEEDITKIFPELKESEDERIRKEIIAVFKGQTAFTTEEDGKKYIAWLEKQHPVEEIVERYRTSWFHAGKIQSKMEGLSDEEKYQQGWHDALEKQSEQKQEWSEEDESYLSHVITAINSYYTDDIYSDGKGCENPWREELIRWLKSIKQTLKDES